MIGSSSNDRSQKTPKRFELSSNWRTNNGPTSKVCNASLGHHNTNASPARYKIRGEDDPRTLQSIAEGTRLYVGNMPYIAKLEDVDRLFDEGDYDVEHINMSIDPYTGRNPSYCFVELKSKLQADRAIEKLNGKNILGRPVKIGPGVASSKKKYPHQQLNPASPVLTPVFDRWTRTDATDHRAGYNEQGQQDRRLWVGGLPRMGNHHAVNDEVRSLFQGYQLEAISKVVVPRSPAFGDAATWNHRYLFVDFLTAEDADRAAQAANGTQAWGVKIRVLPAKTVGPKEIGDWRVDGPL